MVQLSVVVASEEKNNAVRATEESGRSLSREIEHRLRWYRENETRLGGPRIMHLLQSLAEIAQKMHVTDSWLGDPDDYAAVVDTWNELLEDAAPYSVEKEIALGRELIAELPTAEPYVARRMRLILYRKSRLTRLPPEIRAEFAAAAKAPDWDPSLPSPTEAEVRAIADSYGMSIGQARDFLIDRNIAGNPELPHLAAETQRFLTTWMQAKTMVASILGAEPDKRAIAEYFAASPELRILGGYWTPTVSSGRILEDYGQILALVGADELPEATPRNRIDDDPATPSPLSPRRSA
jgi:hypothetical protein